jgi:hypothetical protein
LLLLPFSLAQSFSGPPCLFSGNEFSFRCLLAHISSGKLLLGLFTPVARRDSSLLSGGSVFTGSLGLTSSELHGGLLLSGVGLCLLLGRDSCVHEILSNHSCGISIYQICFSLCISLFCACLCEFSCSSVFNCCFLIRNSLVSFGFKRFLFILSIRSILSCATCFGFGRTFRDNSGSKLLFLLACSTLCVTCTLCKLISCTFKVDSVCLCYISVTFGFVSSFRSISSC